jgi:hypothetical protein
MKPDKPVLPRRRNREDEPNAPVRCDSTERETELPEAEEGSTIGRPALGTPLCSSGPSRQASLKPVLIIGNDLLAAAREVRDALACCGYIFGRGTPTKVVRSAQGGVPKAIPLTAEQIVFETHRLRQPVRLDKHGRSVPTILPQRVARMYLAMPEEWNLPPLVGICTAPLLASDGSVPILCRTI